jgi:opacity protein-like surface antigen
MNKTILKCAVSAAILLVSLAGPAEERTGFYAAANGSLDYVDYRARFGETSPRNGHGAAAAFGYYLGSFRIEAELGFKRHSNDRYYPRDLFFATVLPGYAGEEGGRSDRLTFMANVFYDFSLNDRWDYYLGGGAGVMSFSGRAGSTGFTHNDYSHVNRFAGQVLTGFAYHVTPRIAVTLSYRFAAAEKAYARGFFIYTRDFNSLELGLRFKL